MAKKLKLAKIPMSSVDLTSTKSLESGPLPTTKVGKTMHIKKAIQPVDNRIKGKKIKLRKDKIEKGY